MKAERYCTLLNDNTCYFKKQKSENVNKDTCCNFCSQKDCEHRCLNSWEKCGVLEVVFK